MKKNLGIIVGATTFGLFMIEAILHYNMGVKKDNPNEKFTFPDNKELGKLALVVGIFSVMNGVIINEVKKSL
tara:strand:- start:178 stop:393 length:216 start_codon:yes stop_codon:yes gene_type:complete